MQTCTSKAGSRTVTQLLQWCSAVDWRYRRRKESLDQDPQPSTANSVVFWGWITPHQDCSSVNVNSASQLFCWLILLKAFAVTSLLHGVDPSIDHDWLLWIDPVKSVAVLCRWVGFLMHMPMLCAFFEQHLYCKCAQQSCSHDTF